MIVSPKSLPTTRLRRHGLLTGWVLAVAAPAVCLGQQPPVKAPPEYSLLVTTDRPEALYHVGEMVKFHVALTHGQQPADNEEITWTISNDGFPPEETGKATLQEGQTDLAGKLGVPGFLRCEVQFKRDQDTSKGLGAAGIDPLQIKPSASSG